MGDAFIARRSVGFSEGDYSYYAAKGTVTITIDPDKTYVLSVAFHRDETRFGWGFSKIIDGVLTVLYSYASKDLYYEHVTPTLSGTTLTLITGDGNPLTVHWNILEL